MDIRSYIDCLRSGVDLLEINDEIDGQLELSAITDLICKEHGPGLLFNKVKGCSISLATNLFGSDRRMAAVLGHETLEAFGRRLAVELMTAKGATSAQRLRTMLEPLTTEQQPTVRVATDVDLSILPELRFWPKEERSFLTLAVVITREPESSIQNYGLYRVGIVDDKRLTLNLLPGSGAGRHLEKWQLLGKEMPVAIVLGGDPLLIFAAAASLPSDCTEESFCAYITKESFKSSRCQSVSLHCPSSGQIVIEGWVDGRSVLNEGPFGCYTGDYGGSNECPLLEVSALAMVADPLLPLTLAGPLPMEDCWIARGNFEIIRARLKIDIPEISSIAMPLETAFYGLYFVTSTDPLASVDDLSQRMRSLDYLARMKTLILLHNTDDFVSEANWRSLLKNMPSAQIWQNDAADLVKLLNNHPAKLQNDARIIENMWQRLRSAANESTPSKGLRCNPK